MSEHPDTINFGPVDDASPMKPGDAVTVIFPDGATSLLVTKAEPWEDEDGGKGQSVSFIAWPEP